MRRQETVLRSSGSVQAVWGSGSRREEPVPVPGPAGWGEGAGQPAGAGPHRHWDPAVAEQRRSREGKSWWREKSACSSHVRSLFFIQIHVDHVNLMFMLNIYTAQCIAAYVSQAINSLLYFLILSKPRMQTFFWFLANSEHVVQLWGNAAVHTV